MGKTHQTRQLARHLSGAHPNGFTLIEMAVVLLIVALLLGGLLPTLSSRIEQQRMAEVRKQLDEIEQALIGHALSYGRLPCPANSSSNGAESFASGSSSVDGLCSNFFDGYVPAATLGLVTADGYVVDPWGKRIRYAVTSWNNTYTKANGMSSAGVANLAPSIAAYLQVCATATGVTATNCASGSALTTYPGVPLLIYSTGKNGAYAGTGTDEAANSNSDQVFVSHTPTSAAAANGEFDDIVVWLSPNILLNRMVAAGRLP